MFQLDFAALSDRGLVRERNQDVARVVPRLRLALVADGMGRHEHGEVASTTAVDAFEQSFAASGGPGVDADETLERVRRSFREANERVAQHSAMSSGGDKVGTTLVATVFAHGKAILGHIGDSRCYRLRQRELDVLTQDHSVSAEFSRSSPHATRQAKEAAGQWTHVLTRCLNGDGGADVDTQVVHCEPGDVFLLCSGGLWGGISGQVMAGILGKAQSAKDACEQLVAAAWVAGGLDNVGIAVVRLVPMELRLDEPSWLDTATSPSERPADEQ